MQKKYHKKNIAHHWETEWDKGGGNLTCVPRQDFPGGPGARKKLKVRGKVKGSDPGFSKITDFKAF